MNPDQTNGLEEIPSFGDPEGEAIIDPKYSAEREARIDQAYAAYEDARRDMAALDRTRANVEARRRIPIEVETVPVQASSIAIEDAAKGPPRISSKGYVGSPLTQEFIDGILEAHAYMHRRAEEMWKADWHATVDALR